MRVFAYERAANAGEAARAAAAAGQGGASYLAGGTTLVDLMKLNVMRPNVVVDINALERTAHGRIDVGQNGLRLGALVRMADAADHAELQDQYPMIAQSLKLAASQQIRNMASLGGNVLQRTRCTYFRDVSYAACNKPIRDRAAPRWMGSTGPTPCLASATNALRPIPETLPRP